MTNMQFVERSEHAGVILDVARGVSASSKRRSGVSDQEPNNRSVASSLGRAAKGPSTPAARQRLCLCNVRSTYGTYLPRSRTGYVPVLAQGEAAKMPDAFS